MQNTCKSRTTELGVPKLDKKKNLNSTLKSIELTLNDKFKLLKVIYLMSGASTYKIIKILN